MVDKGGRVDLDKLEQQDLLEITLRTIFLTALTVEGRVGEGCRGNAANKEHQEEMGATAAFWSLKGGSRSKTTK